ncbi:hypothetical protein ACEPAF_1714 [Sanghuangporus sanghuang]
MPIDYERRRQAKLQEQAADAGIEFLLLDTRTLHNHPTSPRRAYQHRFFGSRTRQEIVQPVQTDGSRTLIH